MDAPLTQREFDLWREGDDTFKHVMRGFINTQTALNLSVQGRLSTVEAEQEECKEFTNRRATWISGVVAAIIGSVGAWLATIFSK